MLDGTAAPQRSRARAKHAVVRPSVDARVLASGWYWVYALAAAVLLGAASGATLGAAALLDGLGALGRLMLGVAGLWGAGFAVLGVRLALRYRAGEVPTL